MPSPAAITIHLFGISAFIAGLVSVFSPTTSAQNLSVDGNDSSLVSIRGNGLAAIAMGIYYNLAGYQENRAFMIATVPMRLFTTFIFLKSAASLPEERRSGWMTAGLWEGFGAVVTAVMLFVETKQKTN